MQPIQKLDRIAVEQAIINLEKLDYNKASLAEIDLLLEPLFLGYTVSAPVFEPGIHIFRGRICDKPKILSEISYPASKYVNTYGRANDIGQSMFYGSIGKSIPFFELGVKVGDTLIMSLWRTKETLKLNHIGFTNEAFQYLKSNRNLKDVSNLYRFIDETKSFNDANALVYNYLAKIFTKKIMRSESSYYKLSIAVTKKLINTDFIDGIMYPTIAMKANADNVVLKPNYVNSKLEFINAQFLQITKMVGTEYSFDVLDSVVEVNSSQELQWTGKQFSWNIKGFGDSLTLKSEASDWWALDNNGNPIYPQAAGKLDQPVNHLDRKFRDDSSYGLSIDQEFPLNSDTTQVNVKLKLIIDVNLHKKDLAFYITKCDDALNVAINLFNLRKNWINLDKDSGLDIQTETEGKKYYSSNYPFSQKITFYSETSFGTEVFDTAQTGFQLKFFFL